VYLRDHNVIDHPFFDHHDSAPLGGVVDAEGWIPSAVLPPVESFQPIELNGF
jgi:hypothetical protein